MSCVPQAKELVLQEKYSIMEQIIEKYINLNDRLTELECITTNSICFLPENIVDAKSVSEFIYIDSTQTVKKLFKKNNISVETLDSNPTRFRQKRSSDWFAPTLFIGFSLLSDNSTMVSLALNVISNYLTDFFKGNFGEKKVKMEIIIETFPKKTYKRLIYEGNTEGLKNLEVIIKSLKE